MLFKFNCDVVITYYTKFKNIRFSSLLLPFNTNAKYDFNQKEIEKYLKERKYGFNFIFNILDKKLTQAGAEFDLNM